MSRLAALLAQADLANRDLDIARTQADRDAQNWQTASQAIQGLVPAVSKMGDVYEKNQDDEFALAAKKALAENANTEGDHAKMDVPAEGPATESGQTPTASVDDPNHYAETPEQLAQRVVSRNAALQGPQKTGDFFTDFANDPFGMKSRAAARAQVAAEQGVVTGVDAAREKARNETRQTANDQINAQKVAADVASSNAAAAKATADVGDIKAQQAAREAALAKQQRDEVLRNAVVQAGPGASPFSINKVVGLDVPIADIQAMQDDVARGNEAGDAKVGAEKAQANQANAAAAKDYAEADKARSGANNKNASSLSDVADFKSAVADVADTAGKIDGGHIRRVLAVQDMSKNATEHGGIKGALVGGLANQTLGAGDMTNDEARLMTQLAALKAKSVKGLEGQHRTVSQHQIDLIDSALSSLKTGNMPQFHTQLAALAQTADETAAAIKGSGTSTPNVVADEAPPWMK